MMRRAGRECGRRWEADRDEVGGGTGFAEGLEIRLIRWLLAVRMLEFAVRRLE
jgi:hypothetical protein